MNPQQERFGFDVFEAAGWTQTPIEDFEARQRAEQRARERRERAERERRQEREQRERDRRRARPNSSCESAWDVLGVRMGASKAEVRAAWVAACKRHHPDSGGDAETMKRVNAAWNSLKGGLR